VKRFLNQVLPNSWLMEPNDLHAVLTKHEVVLMFTASEQMVVRTMKYAVSLGFCTIAFSGPRFHGGFEKFVATIDDPLSCGLFIMNIDMAVGFRVRRPTAIIIDRSAPEDTIIQAAARVRNKQLTQIYLL
jgi:hypothetical protein